MLFQYGDRITPDLMEYIYKSIGYTPVSDGHLWNHETGKACIYGALAIYFNKDNDYESYSFRKVRMLFSESLYGCGIMMGFAGKNVGDLCIPSDARPKLKGKEFDDGLADGQELRIRLQPEDK